MTQWRRCSACKEAIELGSMYWTCNVSTCNRKRTGLVFCSVSCWEVHLPIANHREAWAEEQRAPTRFEEPAQEAKRAPAAAAPKRVAPPRAARESGGELPVLIVASRLKDYIRAQSGFNTSDRVLVPLSAAVRRLCDSAIANARRDGRGTAMGRDVPKD